MTDIVNGLAVTKHRKAFLRAVYYSRARVVRFHHNGEAWDQLENYRVTARLEEAFRHGWVEPVPKDELWPGARSKDQVTYYRLTEIGRRILTGGNS